MSDNLPVPVPDFPTSEIRVLSERYRKADGTFLKVMNKFGSYLERRVPDEVWAQVNKVTERALQLAWEAADFGGRSLPDVGRYGSLAAVMTSGAVGGALGVVSSVVELPVTITMFLHAIRAEAIAAGFDPSDPYIRAECLKVFTAGTPVAGDDGLDTAFLSARMTLTGPVITEFIQSIASKLAVTLSQKLAVQAVPAIGAASGAALNAAYLSYYRELAAIRFALLRLSEQHGAGAVLEAFGRAAVPAVRT